MRRAARCAAACAVVLAAATLTARAYNDDPDADQLFPAWRAVQCDSPVSGFNTSSICYEIYGTGVHRAEAHFRNVSDEPVAFDFWAPGRQRPGDNERLVLEPYLRTKAERKVELLLRHGRPGLLATAIRVCGVVAGRGGAQGVTESELVPATDVGEDAMPVVALRDDAVLRRACLTARFIRHGDETLVAFHNPSPRDLHFQFQIPALGHGPRDTARVHVVAGGDATATVRATGHTKPLPLLRVIVSDVRAGDDSGRLFAEDRSADAGFFPLVTSDRSTPLPHEKLLAMIDAAGPRSARVRLRSRMRTSVRLRFVVPQYQRSDHDNGVVTVEPGAETETTVALDSPADARLGVARLRVTDVAHRDDE